MREKHANIPIFIPHEGCPHTCVFCDQQAITGSPAPKPGTVSKIIENAVETLGGRSAEIAFFGGSFTAIDRTLMIAYLEAAQPFIGRRGVRGIRLSTRPDAIDGEILAILARYGVTTIELGIQSMDDEVLRLAGRGHTEKQSENAMRLIARTGAFRVVGQMMLGLPGSTREKDLYTAKRICALGADAARIYPTAVLKNTPLAHLTDSGNYSPLSLEEGVERGADCLSVFLKYGVQVLRMGLCAQESCLDAVTAGCCHPAYGEMVRSRFYKRLLEKQLRRCPPPPGGLLTVFFAPGELSAVSGYRKENKKKLTETYKCAVKLREDPSLEKYRTRIEIRGNDSALKIT